MIHKRLSNWAKTLSFRPKGGIPDTPLNIAAPHGFLVAKPPRNVTFWCLRKLFQTQTKLYFLLLLFLALAGCRAAEQDTPATTVPPTGRPTAVQSPVPTHTAPPASPTPAESPQVAIPLDGVIRFPVSDLALETVAALFAAEHPARDDFALAAQLLGLSQDALIPTLDSTPLEINARTNFYVNTNLNNEYRAIPARLRALTDHAAWWTTVSARATDEEIALAAEAFETTVWPINQLIFGQESIPGIDGDPRIHILLTEEPLWGDFFGYFSNLNQYPLALQPYSNQREMFVINLGGVSIASDAFSGELGHEYQHLIHWSLDPNEDLWLNEAMGELAIFLNGSAPAPGMEGRCDTASKSNLEVFACHPEIQLTSRPERHYGDQDMSVLAHYGAERLFSVYLLEQFGPQFIKDVVNNPEPGVFSIQRALDKLPTAPRFDDVYANWLLANLLIQPDLAEGQYGYREIIPVRPMREVINTFRGEPIHDQLPPYGASYYELQAQEDVQVSFTGSTLTRLTPVDPASGTYAWYSNRGDQSNFSLTRPFDLTGLTTATLRYKVWYELEDYYDYAYLEISTDGGQTWTILPTAFGTGDDPKDRAYGWGYTGTRLDWAEETIDLSAYAGQVVQLRFEVISDFTTNRDGFQLDDLEIPELNYFDGAEDDAGGWEAHGFIRSANVVPVNWILWLIELTIPTRVTRLELTPDQLAEINISGFGQDFPFAALVVSPTAPVSTLEVEYELTFTTP